MPTQSHRCTHNSPIMEECSSLDSLRHSHTHPFSVRMISGNLCCLPSSGVLVCSIRTDWRAILKLPLFHHDSTWLYFFWDQLNSVWFQIQTKNCRNTHITPELIRTWNKYLFGSAFHAEKQTGFPVNRINFNGNLSPNEFPFGVKLI